MANFKILPDVPEFVGLVVVDVTAGGIVLLCFVCTWGACMKMQGKYVNHLKFIIYIILFNLIISNLLFSFINFFLHWLKFKNVS